MIVLLSPTKTFNKNVKKGNNNILFYDKTINLIDKIQKIDKYDFKTKFKLSDSLANSMYEYYSNYNETFLASYLYGGTAFKYLDPKSISEDKLKNLYIFSALYGLNNAFTNISLYRLDLKDKVTDVSLYKYWEKTLNEYFDNNFKNKIIINLASNEYYKLIDINKDNIYTIDFKNKEKRTGSMELKKMRGLFAREVLINNIKNIDDLKNIVLENYTYSNELSKDNLIVFERS